MYIYIYLTNSIYYIKLQQYTMTIGLRGRGREVAKWLRLLPTAIPRAFDAHVKLSSHQKEKLGTLGRVPEIYTNIYHLYMYRPI